MAKEALRFYDENENWKQQGMYLFGENNGHEIVITSDNNEYVKGDLLYVEYKGAKIYAELDQAIYINTKTDVVMIKKNKKLSPPSEREYLCLLVYYNGHTDFQGVLGRQEVFDYLKANIEEIDIVQSLILAETVAFKDAISVYEFMRQSIINETVVNDDGFDIEEYYFEPTQEE